MEMAATEIEWATGTENGQTGWEVVERVIRRRRSNLRIAHGTLVRLELVHA